VVAVTIERGGFGAEAAAPAARKILAALFGVKDERKTASGTQAATGGNVE
jgi:cell division protein FtsI/penicillin-binding protein 2